MTRKKAGEKPVEVEATIVEDPGAQIVRVDFTPAAIAVDWEGIDGKLTELLEPYEDTTAEVVAGMDPKEVRICKSDLGNIRKELDEARKAVKRAYTAPLNEFEGAVKERLARIDGKKALFDDAAKLAEAAWKEARRELCADAYYDFMAGNGADELAEAISPDKVIEASCSQVLLKKTSDNMAAKIMQEAAAKVLTDYRTLHNHELKFKDEAELEFFKTLSIAAALNLDARRYAEQQQLEAVRKEAGDVEEFRGQDEQAPVETYEPDAPSIHIPVFDVEAERVETYAIFVGVTASQKAALIDFFRAAGIHGQPVRTSHPTWQQAVDEYRAVM